MNNTQKLRLANTKFKKNRKLFSTDSGNWMYANASAGFLLSLFEPVFVWPIDYANEWNKNRLIRRMRNAII